MLWHELSKLKGYGVSHPLEKYICTFFGERYVLTENDDSPGFQCIPLEIAELAYVETARKYFQEMRK